MADSPKQLNQLVELEAEIDRLLPDGNNGDIKPQHVRESFKMTLRRWLRLNTKVLLAHNGIQTPYSSYRAAINDAVAGDLIILQDNLNEQLTLKNGVNVNGNGFSLLYSGSGSIYGEATLSNVRASFFNFDVIKATGEYAIAMSMVNSVVYIQARRIEANDQAIEIWAGSTKLIIDAEEILATGAGKVAIWTGESQGELIVRGTKITGAGTTFVGTNATFIECSFETPGHAYWGAGAPAGGVTQKLIRCNLVTDLVKGGIRTAGAITLVMEDCQVKCKGLVSNAGSDNALSAISHDCSGPLILHGVNVVQAYLIDSVYSKTKLVNMGQLLVNKAIHSSSAPCQGTEPEINALIEL